MLRKIFYIFYGLILLFSISCVEGDDKLSSKTMNVMSFNILCDEGPQWDKRINQVSGVVHFHDCDIIGMQEVRYNQKEDLQRLLPEFTHVGVGRTDGAQKGEYCSIFYRTNRFTQLDSGTFWLAENETSVGEKGWDAAYERIVTWVLLEDRLSEKTFLMMNTHLDHIGKVARREEALMLLKKSVSLSKGFPVILTGDFNAVKEDEPIQIILDKKNPDAFKDCRDMAKLWYGPNWTFHGGLDQLESYVGLTMIDYIFIRGGISVLKAGVLSATLNGRYPSDHCPLLSTLLVE